MLPWMAWTWQTALFFGFVALALIILTLLAIYRPETPRVGILRFPDDARRPLLRDPDRLGLHLHLLDAVRRRRAVVPAGRVGDLRDRDVPLRVARIGRRALCASGVLGGSKNGRQTSRRIEGGGGDAAAAATRRRRDHRSTPTYAQQLDAAKKWVDNEFQPSTLTKDQQMAEMEWFINAARRSRA